MRRQGGTILTAEVKAIRPDGASVHVDTNSGSHQADVAVIAAGAWSLKLLQPLGLNLPLIAERGYHMTFANPGITLKHVMSDIERSFAVSNMEMGLRVAGTEELGDADDPPSWRRAEVLKRIAQEILPNLNVNEGTRWMGPRPGTPDSLPAIGPLPGHPNIYVACGHGHLGLTGARTRAALSQVWLPASASISISHRMRRIALVRRQRPATWPKFNERASANGLHIRPRLAAAS
ncbi:MAG: FAD-binding oxidoreductase [Rhodospirillales bacterium]|nr:FAD-binding oxidoreductase [Rhodospirillales bacterium]